MDVNVESFDLVSSEPLYADRELAVWADGDDGGSLTSSTGVPKKDMFGSNR